jgi:hypothetical protein
MSRKEIESILEAVIVACAAVAASVCFIAVGWVAFSLIVEALQ